MEWKIRIVISEINLENLSDNVKNLRPLIFILAFPGNKENKEEIFGFSYGGDPVIDDFQDGEPIDIPRLLQP